MYPGSFSFYHYSPLRSWKRLLRSQEQKAKIIGITLAICIIILQSMVVHLTYIDVITGRSLVLSVPQRPTTPSISSTKLQNVHINLDNIKKLDKRLDNNLNVQATPRTISSNSSLLKSDEAKSNKLVVVGYYNGGSSMLEILLEKHPESFYWAEPLNGLYNGFFKRSGAKRSYIYNGYDVAGLAQNNVTRAIQTTALEAIMDVINCNMTRLPRDMVEHNFLYTSTNPRTRPYKRCVRKHKSLPPLGWIKKCVPLLENGCSISQMRSIKITHMSLRLISDVMSRVPDLKVIHLVRDPRVIVQSRNIRLERLSSHLPTICEAMLQDIETFDELVKRYPGRLIQVKFESLLLGPDSVSDVLKFSGLRIQKDNSDLAAAPSAHANDAIGNVTDIVNKWRQELSPNDFTNVMSSCQKVLNHFDYDVYG